MRGAFTGAHSSKQGLLAEADGGTIFLDEIGDASPSFQSKLLRVLQEGEIKPVGSSRSMKVNVRVISATNKNLSQQVQGKTFREDLYYRLSVLPMILPALRERAQDIPLSGRAFCGTVFQAESQNKSDLFRWLPWRPCRKLRGRAMFESFNIS